MSESAYHERLVTARIVANSGYAKGIPVWREPGLAVVDRLVAVYLAELGAFSRPARVEHPFLTPAEGYQAVFGDYTNIYGGHVPQAGGAVAFRPDNLPASVAWLRERDLAGPAVAVGGLLRRLAGISIPLFRDRHIWPAIQANQLVRRADSVALLDAHQRALERTFHAIGLPVVSVRTDAISGYGRLCYLTVSCLPDGRATVLSTAYLMADRYRSRLGVAEDVLDVGFTGKAIALVAMHHADSRGIVLPSAIAPVQVGLLTDGTDPAEAPWLVSLAAAGLRVRTADPGRTPYRRHRAERRFHAGGAPVVVGLSAEDGARIASRVPLTRRATTRLPTAAELGTALSDVDARLLAAARARFDRGLRKSGMALAVCVRCADTGRFPVFGWVVPARPAACAGCGRAGHDALVSGAGRFY